MVTHEVISDVNIVDFAQVCGVDVEIIDKAKKLGGQRLDPNPDQVRRMTKGFDSLIGHTPNK